MIFWTEVGLNIETNFVYTTFMVFSLNSVGTIKNPLWTQNLNKSSRSESCLELQNEKIYRADFFSIEPISRNSCKSTSWW